MILWRGEGEEFEECGGVIISAFAWQCGVSLWPSISTVMRHLLLLFSSSITRPLCGDRPSRSSRGRVTWTKGGGGQQGEMEREQQDEDTTWEIDQTQSGSRDGLIVTGCWGLMFVRGNSVSAGATDPDSHFICVSTILSPLSPQVWKKNNRVDRIYIWERSLLALQTKTTKQSWCESNNEYLCFSPSAWSIFMIKMSVWQNRLDRGIAHSKLWAFLCVLVRNQDNEEIHYIWWFSRCNNVAPHLRHLQNNAFCIFHG